MYIWRNLLFETPIHLKQSNQTTKAYFRVLPESHQDGRSQQADQPLPPSTRRRTETCIWTPRTLLQPEECCSRPISAIQVFNISRNFPTKNENHCALVLIIRQTFQDCLLVKTRSDGRDYVRGAEGALYPQNYWVQKREQKEKQTIYY